MRIGIIAVIVTVSYLIGITFGTGIGTATYLTLLILYKRLVVKSVYLCI